MIYLYIFITIVPFCSVTNSNKLLIMMIVVAAEDIVWAVWAALYHTANTSLMGHNLSCR